MKLNLGKLASLIEQIKSLSQVIGEDIVKMENEQRLAVERQEYLNKQKVELQNREAYINRIKSEWENAVRLEGVNSEAEIIKLKERELAITEKEKKIEAEDKDIKERLKKVGDLEAVKSILAERDRIVTEKEKKIIEREDKINKEIAIDMKRKEILKIKEIKLNNRMRQLQMEADI